jgi:alpha-D-ribose 1-methylphosphonate 5-phosphate C-P lyase
MTTAADNMADALRAILLQVVQGKVLERDACITQARVALADHDKLQPAPENRIRKVCSVCGGEEISFDAFVTWDTDEQQFVVSNVMDDGHWCADCDGECTPQDEPLNKEGA